MFLDVPIILHRTKSVFFHIFNYFVVIIVSYKKKITKNIKKSKNFLFVFVILRKIDAYKNTEKQFFYKKINIFKSPILLKAYYLKKNANSSKNACFFYFKDE